MGYRLENKDINLNEKKFTRIAQGKTDFRGELKH